MSVEMMTRVWKSELPTDEKFVALALADCASPDGRNIWPAQATIARMVGKTTRAVRDTIRKLEARGVLVADPWPDDNRYRPTNRYRMPPESLTPPEDASAPPEGSSARPPEGVSRGDSSRPPEGSSAPPESSSATPGSGLPDPPEVGFLRSVRDPEEEEEDPDLITPSTSCDPDPDARAIETARCAEHSIEGLVSRTTAGQFYHRKPGGGFCTFVPDREPVGSGDDPYARVYQR